MTDMASDRTEPLAPPREETTRRIERAILRHAPMLAIHPRENARPCDPAAYLVHRDAEHHDRRRKRDWWKGPGLRRRIQLGTADDLVQGRVSAGAVEGRLVLRPGAPNGPAAHVDSPLLVEVTTLPGQDLAVTYWFFWADNHAVPGLFRNALMSHDGDWERIVLRLDLELRPTRVAYHAHGGYHERAWADVPTVDGHPDRPMVWCALGSHACYPEPGWQWPRLFDFAAPRLEHATLLETWPDDTVTRVESQPWYRIGVRWGDGPRPWLRSGPSPFGPGNRTGCPAAWFDRDR